MSMIKATDKIGQVVYVATNMDYEEEYRRCIYCETFSDEQMENKIDDLVVHSWNCNIFDNEQVEEYIKNYYKGETLDLNYKFYKF